MVGRYNNYHKHDHRANPWIPDSAAKEIDYCKRASELGHTMVFTTNHGMQGDTFSWIDGASQYGLRICYGTEAYYVDNYEEKERGKHLIVMARNTSGALQLNNLVSKAHTEGFYYRPRIDRKSLFELCPDDFIITTACVAGIWDDTELIMALYRRFGDHFFLELQNHDMDLQKKVNRQMLDLHSETGIKIIHANDSHYIYPQDSKYRDIYLKGKKMFYEEETGMVLDYPDSETIYKRYKKQGILTEDQVTEALENTLIFDDCEDVHIINDDIKLPSVSDHPQEDLRQIINDYWKKERKNIPKSEWPRYLEAIRTEVDTIEKTHMENYFLIDYNVAKDGQEKYNGRLTNTGRGSAPSFYTTKALGLTDIDRVASPITLFPSRFMSVERILNARSLPDIDMNTSDREPFIKATEDLLGKENCAWMIAWKPLQKASAFRLYCRGIGLDISEYDDIAKDIDSYADDKKWKPIIHESEKFIGVVESISESPCSMMLWNHPVKEYIGMVRTSRGKICCLLDGYNCDKYKFLKNDYLTVTVWAIIRDVCEMAGIKIPTIKELDKLLDEKTFDIYKNGLTCTINQADSDYATNLVKEYKPQSVSEMSAFVAIIRPGCASLLDGFIHRQPYSTGVEELDSILKDSGHRLIYQESIMKYLIWLGIPEAGSYDIIKKIAKKKFKEKELSELKEKLLAGWMKQVGKEEGFEETWTVIEQAAHYSFNASHSLSYAYDSLYGAYLKSHYPLEYYTVVFNYYDDDSTRTAKLKDEIKSFGIQMKPARFRMSKSGYTLSREDNSIYKGIKSIKDLNANSADEMYELRNNEYSGFIPLLYDLKEKTSLNSRQIRILIALDFFSEFGDANKLLAQYSLFDNLYCKKQIKKDKLLEYGLSPEAVAPFAAKETEKQFSGVSMEKLLYSIADSVKYQPRSLKEIVAAQAEYLGYIDIVDPKYRGVLAVLDVNTKYSPKLSVYALKNGNQMTAKINKTVFNKQPLSAGDVILVQGQQMKTKKRRNEEGKFEDIPGEKELWITKYRKIGK